MRTHVYIDGFNLYYGALKDTPYKWLDLQKYFDLLRSSDDIQTIFYFTAEIDGSHRQNQQTYLSALATLPKVEIVLGNFKFKQVRCRVKDCDFKGRRFFRTPEEKRTDVNIAVQMVQDAYERACEHFVVVSGDSDLVPAIHAVKGVDSTNKVTAYIPATDPKRGAAVELRSAADKARILPNILLRRTQFLKRIPDGFGGWLEKPSDW